MSTPFAPPPIGRHCHIVQKSRIQRPYCSRCGYTLEFLLRTQPTVEIAQPLLPLAWTAWRMPRTTEVPRA